LYSVVLKSISQLHIAGRKVVGLFFAEFYILEIVTILKNSTLGLWGGKND